MEEAQSRRKRLEKDGRGCTNSSMVITGGTKQRGLLSQAVGTLQGALEVPQAKNKPVTTQNTPKPTRRRKGTIQQPFGVPVYKNGTQWGGGGGGAFVYWHQYSTTKERLRLRLNMQRAVHPSHRLIPKVHCRRAAPQIHPTCRGNARPQQRSAAPPHAAEAYRLLAAAGSRSS